jgi:metal-responsive CopG/Arc/MetJ family transcriptional regulator
LLDDNHELIYVPEYLVQKIDDIIKNGRLYRNREDFVFDAIEKFISDAVKEKIERSYIRKYG